MQIRITLHSRVIYIPKPFYKLKYPGWPLRFVYPGVELEAGAGICTFPKVGSAADTLDTSLPTLVSPLGELTWGNACLAMRKALGSFLSTE